MPDVAALDQGAPFAAHPLLTARSREDLAAGLWRTYGAKLRAAETGGRPLFASANRVEIGGVNLHYCRYDTPVEIEFRDMPGVRQVLCLSGRGALETAGRRLEVDEATTCIIPPTSTFKAEYSAGYEHLILQFDQEALRRKAEAITGAPLRGAADLPFLEALPMRSRVRSSAIARTLGRILALEGARTAVSTMELAQALGTAFLEENASGFATDPATPQRLATQARARLLEDYIQQNWNRPISVEDIAAACGVSARSVFAQFRQHRGVTPLVYLRELRLDHAHRLLVAPDNTQSVIDVALACGFASFGHFARRYRDRFGELPSTTKVRGELGGVLDVSRRQ